MKIKFEDISTENITITNKPRPSAGKDFPLQQLEHYDFERLLYSLYKSEIEHGYLPSYQSIQLMSGVRDNGKDCALFKGGILKGIIQCKHSRDNSQVTEPLCAKEIIKYCLYSIQRADLIPDINSFTYYFAASAGFDTNAAALFQTFNKSLPEHKKLEAWTNQVIKGTKSLEGFTFATVENKLKEILKKLLVKPIIPTDIDLLLHKDSNKFIIEKFFEVVMVVETTSIEKIEKKLDSLQTRKTLTNKEILQEFSAASVFLSEELKSSFSVEGGLKLDRKVSTSLISWIKSPVEENKNIAVLKGAAGSGKSVIMNQVYQQLIKDEIPIIGFKADIYKDESIQMLEEKCGLSIPLTEAINILSDEHEKIVVIIDQIDALSQTLSANRDYLTTYILLTSKLKINPQTRIIISSREYDLNFDAGLIPLKKHSIFDAGSLDIDEVNSVLKKVNFSTDNKKLLRLLQVPLHLEIFCQLSKPKVKQDAIQSIYDLYNALWKTKAEDGKTKEMKKNCADTLYQLAAKMYEEQTLALPTARFDQESLRILESEGLLHRKDKVVQFFHQTFYDFTFARQFVESGKDIVAYLQQNRQGLFIRSCLKIILNYLREYDLSAYTVLIEKLLSDKNTRFHIKELVVSVLAYTANPFVKETKLVKKVIMGSRFETLFLETIHGSGWIQFLMEEGYLIKLMRSKNELTLHAGTQMLFRNCDLLQKEQLEWLISLPNRKIYNTIISHFLFYLTNWNKQSIALFERIRKLVIANDHAYSHMLKNAMKFDPAWAIDEFKSTLLKRASALKRKKKYVIAFGYPETNLLQKFADEEPEKTFSLCDTVISTIIQQTKFYNYNNSPIYHDHAFYFFTREKGTHDQEELLEIFISLSEKLAKIQSPVFNSFENKYKKSQSVTQLRILLYAYLASPHLYTSAAFSLFISITTNQNFDHHDKLHHLLRKVIYSIFSFLPTDEKSTLLSTILSIKVQNECGWYVDNTGKKKIYSAYGLAKYKYLCSIPAEAFSDFLEVRKIFHELTRRFGKVTDEEPNVVRIAGVHAPYDKSKYRRMSLENWYRTFQKITPDFTKDNNYEKGSMLAHLREFEIEVKERPDFFFPLIEQIASDNHINPSYLVYGIEGLINANYNAHHVSKVYLKVIAMDLPTELMRFAVHQSNFFVKADLLSEEMLNFLCRQALVNTDPDKDDLKNPHHGAINSVRGAAVESLVTVNDKSFASRIFETLQQVMEQEPFACVMSPIAVHGAYLLNLDPAKAFDLFLSVISTHEILIKESLWSADYFSRSYFERMIPYFQKASLVDFKKEQVRNLTIILAREWLRDQPGSEKLLFDYLERSEQVKSYVIDVAVHPKHIILPNGKLNERCIRLFELSLDSSNPDIIHEYSTAFLRMEGELFEPLFPLLKKYSLSNAFKHSPGYFCGFILPFTKSFPEKCIELISHFDQFIPTNITKSNYYDQEPLQVVLSIYNGLGDNPIHNKMKTICLDMFDKMLQLPHLRSAANKALEFAEN